MDARTNLKDVRAELVAREVVDVKFCFSEAREMQPSHVTSDVHDALKAYTEGRVHPLPVFGDSVRAK